MKQLIALIVSAALCVACTHHVGTSMPTFQPIIRPAFTVQEAKPNVYVVWIKQGGAASEKEAKQLIKCVYCTTQSVGYVIVVERSEAGH